MSYLDAVRRAVDGTPESRNRVADTWRVIALLVVVFGHWLSASVWVEPDGTITVLNSLEWIPYAAWATWIVQVMPVFFFVGGYANAKALRSRSTNRRTWLVTRFRRLFTPAVPVILVWTALSLVLRPFIDADLVYAGVLNATIPLWFLAVYLMLIAIAPLTEALWERFGLPTIAALALAALLVDVAYRGLDVPGVGWLNLVFVWGTIHQLGYWWEAAEREGSLPHPVPALAVSAAALGGLIVVTVLEWYPVAMITIPGAGPQNVTPPTSALILLAIVQIGIILATAGPMGRWSHRRRPWMFVVAVSGFIMSIYVWHLTALSLTIAAGIFTFDGALFSAGPGTAVWWVTRPVFFAVLVLVTGAFVGVFGRFERDIDPNVPDRPMPLWAVGMALTIVSLSATAFVYLVDRDANLTWWIPAVTVAAAAVMGAWPKRVGGRR